VVLSVCVFVLYGAYLFARVAWRTRRALLFDSPAERRDIRKRALVSLACLLSVAAGDAVMPAPTLVRVMGALLAVLLLPLVLAREFEPPKRKGSTRHR
jgi:protein-S-isoprenylcysteine O-methyltransferase Ste14